GLVGDIFLNDAPVALRRDFVGGRPQVAAVLKTEVHVASLEGLELDRRVAVVVVADDIPVVLTRIDGEVLAPIVGNTLQRDPTAGNECVDLIGAAAERRIKRRLVELSALPIVLRKNCKLADNQRQFTIAASLESELP